MFVSLMKAVRYSVIAGGLCFSAAGALAKTCEILVEGSDSMQFNTKELTIGKDCKEVKLTLKHTGKLPKSAMGHNLVISSEKDQAGILAESAKAGLAKDYLPEGDKRVVAATKLLGGGETSTITFKKDLLKAGEAYKFFCTFPGHSGLMQGVVKF